MPIIEAMSGDPRAIALMNAQQRELRAVYQDTDERTEPFDPAVLEGAGSVLLAEEVGGELLSCGAIKRLDARTAEVKRMYTRPEARGRGLGRAILRALMTRGRELGYERLVLETGDQQPAAVLLYESEGFGRIPNFGYYVGMANSLCFERWLVPPSGGLD